jgi:hypothetical protein
MGTSKEFYDAAFLEKQIKYYLSLPEKQRRYFLSMEYERLGNGSKRYLSRVFKCDRQTINRGLQELSDNDYHCDYSRQRAKGGGRKKKNNPLSN